MTISLEINFAFDIIDVVADGRPKQFCSWLNLQRSPITFRFDLVKACFWVIKVRINLFSIGRCVVALPNAFG